MNNRRNYAITFLANAGSIGLSSVLALIAMPIGLSYWGIERFGVWSLLTSIIIYLSIFNFGLDSACSILMAKSPIVRDKMIIFRRTIVLGASSATAALLGFMALTAYLPNWLEFTKLFSPQNLPEAASAIFILVVSYLVNLPFSMVAAAYSGFQKLYLEKLFVALFSVLSFIVLLLTVFFRLGMTEYALGYGLSTLTVNVLRSIVFYFGVYRRSEIVDSHLSLGQSEENREVKWSFLINLSGRLFTAGLAGLAIYFSDNAIISVFLGASAVSAYVVTNRLYQLMLQVGFLFTIPLASLIGREMGKENYRWISGTFNRATSIVLYLAGGFWLGGVLFMSDVIRLWIGTTALTDLPLIVVVGMVTFLAAIGNINQVFINSLNYTRGTQFLGALEAVLKIGVAIALVPVLGTVGLVIGGAVGLSIVEVFWLAWLLERRSNRNIRWDGSVVLVHVAFVLFPLLGLAWLIQAYIQDPAIRVILGVAVFAIYTLASYMVQRKSVQEDWKKMVFATIAKVVASLRRHV